MRASYYCGLGLILFLAVGACWISGGLEFYLIYLNLPSLIVICGTCIGALVCNFGIGGSFSAMLALLSPGRTAAVGFRKSAAKTVMLAAVFGGLFYMIMGFIAALANLADLSKIGPALATGLISLLYGCFLALLMVPAYVSEE